MIHRRDDEAWYVLSGKLGFRLGDDEIEASPGSAYSLGVAFPTPSGTQGKAMLSNSS
jgi:mannose-6-phosphate isomerase-like protein (cupin superfamily)